MKNLNGKVCLLTGCPPPGIGRAIGWVMAEPGGDIIVNYNNSADIVEEAYPLAPQMHPPGRSVQADPSELTGSD